MAFLEERTWTDKAGKQRDRARFTVHCFYDKRRYRVPGFACDATGREQSNELGRNVEKVLEAKAGGRIGPGLRQYLETLPRRIRRSLARQGIIDPAAEGKTLAEHAAEYKAAKLAKGDTERDAREIEATILSVAEACKCKMLGDVTDAKVTRYLADRRADRAKLDREGNPMKGADGKPIMRRGISARRHNGIVAALHSFYRWAVRDGRAYENPIARVARLNPKTDVRHARRALEPAEVRALLTAAEAAGEIHGMSGAERALIYRVAVETGLRMNELATLTRQCVDLDGLTVTVRAAYSKHRREDVLPIRGELAEALREHVEHKAPAAKLFNMPNRFRMLRAFRVDLQAAGIASRDADNRVVDFHGQRHTFISSLAAAGVHPKTAQTLARHSTITLTMDRYTHTLRGAEAAALNMLPNYSTRTAAEARRTGTDDLPTDNPSRGQGTQRRASNAAGGASEAGRTGTDGAPAAQG